MGKLKESEFITKCLTEVKNENLKKLMKILRKERKEKES